MAAFRDGELPHRSECGGSGVQLTSNELGTRQVAIGAFGHQAAVLVLGEKCKGFVNSISGRRGIADLQQRATNAGSVSGRAPGELAPEVVKIVVSLADGTGIVGDADGPPGLGIVAHM